MAAVAGVAALRVTRPLLMRPLVMLAMPCFGGLVHHGTMLSVCRLLQAADDMGFDVDLAVLAGDALITRSRAVLAARFLDHASATHLLFVDADIAFEPAEVLRLLRFDRDVAAAFYPLKSVDWDALPRRAVAGEPLRTAGLTYVGTLLDESERRTAEGFATAAYAGTGFMMVKREALARMVAAYPELRFRSVHARAGRLPASDNLCALFDCVIDPDTGAYLSEDYSFCRRWRALGGDIWLDLESRLTHTGADDFAGDAAARVAAGGWP